MCVKKGEVVQDFQNLPFHVAHKSSNQYKIETLNYAKLSPETTMATCSSWKTWYVKMMKFKTSPS